jgi:hypothetical protein
MVDKQAQSKNGVHCARGVPLLTEYRLPNGGWPGAIVAGPDGALWFTYGNKIGRITTDGVITEYPLPIAEKRQLRDIAVGPDSALWYTDWHNKIGRITELLRGLSRLSIIRQEYRVLKTGHGQRTELAEAQPRFAAPHVNEEGPLFRAGKSNRLRAG